MMIRSALRTALAVFAFLPLTLATESAYAAKAKAKAKAKAEAAAEAPAKKKSVALGAIEGKKSAEVRGWVREVIQTNFELTDAEDFKVKNDDAAIAKMAADLGVEAVVIGKLERNRLVLSVRDATGKQLRQIELKAPAGPKLKTAVQNRLPKQLYGAFGLLTPEEEAKKKALAKQEAEEAGAEEEGGDEEEAAESGEEDAEGEAEAEDGEGEEQPADEETASDAATSGPTGSPLELTAGLHFSKRDFTFNDTLSQLVPNRPVRQPLRDYHAALDILLFLRADFYPGVLLGAKGLGANLGLAGGFEYGIPSKTVYTPAGGAQQNLTSSVQDWHLGGRARFPLSSSFGLGFLFGYGQQKYILKGDEGEPLVPDVNYGSLRVATDLRATLGKITVDARIGARIVLSFGELKNENPNDPLKRIWFDNVGGRAIEAGLTLGYQVTPMIAVIAGGEFLRYGFDFNPLENEGENAAVRVAGGAIDQFMGGRLGVRLTLPGSGSASGAVKATSE